ncbi:MAG: hypothetical protein JXA33_27145 [Anaerolineae bacterium]|nr:hypothetical protein [Anaerolineae bacterium]
MQTNSTITLEIPQGMYTELQSLAQEEEIDLIEMLAQWVKDARKHRTWQQDLQALRDLIQKEGGLQVGRTKEEVVEQMRKTRQEIFEAEYAHLYR